MSTQFYLNQYVTTTLAKVGGLNNTDTTGIVFSSIAGIDIARPGIALFTYSDPLDTTKCEWISYTSINGSTYELNGVVRGCEGFSAHNHNNGCAIAFPISASHINNIPDSTTTFTNKTLTSPKINENVVLTATSTQLNAIVSGGVPTKATGAEITTGTDDAKFVTPKALADATISKIGAAWTNYTPSTANLTIGNGTITGRYLQIGKTVFARISFVLGSTSAIAADALIGLPVTAHGTITALGNARYLDSSASVQYDGWWRDGYLGYPVLYGDITAIVPFTWATGDVIWASINYEAA